MKFNDIEQFVRDNYLNIPFGEPQLMGHTGWELINKETINTDDCYLNILEFFKEYGYDLSSSDATKEELIEILNEYNENFEECKDNAGVVLNEEKDEIVDIDLRAIFNQYYTQKSSDTRGGLVQMPFGDFYEIFKNKELIDKVERDLEPLVRCIYRNIGKIIFLNEAELEAKASAYWTAKDRIENLIKENDFSNDITFKILENEDNPTNNEEDEWRYTNYILELNKDKTIKTFNFELSDDREQNYGLPSKEILEEALRELNTKRKINRQ